MQNTMPAKRNMQTPRPRNVRPQGIFGIWGLRHLYMSRGARRTTRARVEKEWKKKKNNNTIPIFLQVHMAST